MYKALTLASLALLVGWSPSKTQKQNISLILDADFTTGRLLLKCRESSSGTCHVLVAGAREPVRISAAEGESAGGDGAGDGARFCAGASAPQNGCRLTELRDGENIFRASEVKTETR